MGCQRQRFCSLVNSRNRLGATMSPKGHRNYITSILAKEDVFAGVFVKFSVQKLQEVSQERCAARRTAKVQSPRSAFTRRVLNASRLRDTVYLVNNLPYAQCARQRSRKTRLSAKL